MASNKHSLLRPSGGLDSGRGGRRDRGESETSYPGVERRAASKLLSPAAVVNPPE